MGRTTPKGLQVKGERRGRVSSRASSLLQLPDSLSRRVFTLPVPFFVFRGRSMRAVGARPDWASEGTRKSGSWVTAAASSVAVALDCSLTLFEHVRRIIGRRTVSEREIHLPRTEPVSSRSLSVREAGDLGSRRFDRLFRVLLDLQTTGSSCRDVASVNRRDLT